jgi:hypothetical protein
MIYKRVKSENRWVVEIDGIEVGGRKVGEKVGEELEES